MSTTEDRAWDVQQDLAWVCTTCGKDDANCPCDQGDAPVPDITISADIDNYYPSGKVRTTVADVVVPAPPEGDDRSDWEYDHIFQLTGTGRTDRAAKNAAYFVTITASSDPVALPVGTEFEFC